MASTATLKFLLLAENHASKALKDVGGETEKTGRKIGGMSTASKVALAGLGVAAVGFANSSINKFRQVTSESRGLQRAMGGTLEEASRMREAAILAGVDYGTFQKSVTMLDKKLVAATGNQKTAAAMTKTLGISFQDANGKVKPMGQLLPQISDQFAKLPDGPEKSALAMKLFGKAGTAMLPFLGKGSAGIADLEKQSDKFGTTLNNGSIDALAKSREQTRLWQAGMDGLKVQIGAQLLPILNKLIGFIQQYIIPIIQKITAFVHEHKQAVMFAVVVIGTLIVGLKAWAIAQGILNTVMALNPIALIVIAIAALVAGVLWVATKTQFFQHVWQAAWGAIKAVFTGIVDFIKHHWRLLVAILTGGIGAAVIFITSHWTAIKNGFASVVNYISDKVTSIVHFITGIPGRIAGVVSSIGRIGARMGAGLWNGIKGIIGDVGGFGKSLYNAVAQSINWLIDKIKNWHFTIGAFGVHHTFKPFGGIPEIPLMAKGGIVNSPTLAMVGEAGPEAVIPLSKMKDHFGGGGGGRDINVYVHALSTAQEIGQIVKQALELDLNGGGTITVRAGAIRTR
jgi:phage-related protein